MLPIQQSILYLYKRTSKTPNRKPQTANHIRCTVVDNKVVCKFLCAFVVMPHPTGQNPQQAAAPFAVKVLYTWGRCQLRGPT